jgi:predicted nucleotidyltransferase
MLALLQQREVTRRATRLHEWRQAREQLKACLNRHLPGQRVWVFGSLLEPGRFNAASDIDIAIDSLPPCMSIYTLTALLDEDMKRSVDLVYLPESRLRSKIMTQGEPWIG